MANVKMRNVFIQGSQYGIVVDGDHSIDAEDIRMNGVGTAWDFRASQPVSSIPNFMRALGLSDQTSPDEVLALIKSLVEQPAKNVAEVRCRAEKGALRRWLSDTNVAVSLSNGLWRLHESGALASTYQTVLNLVRHTT